MVNGGSSFTGETARFPPIDGCGATMTSILTIALLSLFFLFGFERLTHEKKGKKLANLRSSLILQS
jgi:hypothetical protein